MIDSTCDNPTASGLRRGPHAMTVTDPDTADARDCRQWYVQGCLRAGALLVLGLFAAFLAWRFAPAISTPDANGYWAQGSLLAQEGRTWFVPESDAQYVPMHWLVTPEGRFFSRYPPGLAVIIAPVYACFGHRAAVLVNPALALTGLVGFWLLLRHMTDERWALVGLVMLAGNPVYLGRALICDSHMAVTVLLIWGLFLLLSWQEDRRWWQALLAGVVLGAIPTVRYPEGLFALGVAVFLLWHWPDGLPTRRHIGLAVLGAALPVIPLLVRNQLAFGAFWRTAYSLTNEQTGFAWSYFRGHVVNYVRTIVGQGVGALAGLGLVGAVAMCGVRRRRALGVMVLLLIVPSTLLYMAYYWGPSRIADATMRFVLPTFPCYLLAGVWGLSRWLRETPPGVRWAAAASLCLIQVLWGTVSGVAESAGPAFQRTCLAQITQRIEQVADDNSVIVSERPILEHLDYVRRWRLGEMRGGRGPGLRLIRHLEEADTAAPRPMQLEKASREAEKYAGMTPLEQERVMAHTLRDWAGERAVFVVGPESLVLDQPGFYFAREHLRVVTRFDLPPPPELPRDEGMMGALGPVRPRPRPGADQDAMVRPEGLSPGPGPGEPPLRTGGPPEAHGLQDGGAPRDRRTGRRGLRVGMHTEQVVIAEWIWEPMERPARKRRPSPASRRRWPDAGRD